MDNRAYRYILQISLCTASQFLISEIGASSAKSRYIKNKILFRKQSFQDKSNTFLNEIILKEIQNSEADWAKLVIKYWNKINLN